MAWSFTIDLTKKPLVLAGPILRQVTEVSATVWLVLQRAGNVRLSIRDAQGEIFFGSRKTVAIGKNLHMVAVTAGSLGAGRGPGALLLPGVIYSYEVKIDSTDVTTAATSAKARTYNTLEEATGAKLGYGAFPTPTFCMPPEDPNKLRLIHGSCRHPNGIKGNDALAILDGLISESAADPDRRPHQLFLTGDQIYADDVSGALLMLLYSAADQLLGWSEVLPIPQARFAPPVGPRVRLPGGPPRIGSKVPPYFRARIAKAIGLSSDAADSHLFTLGEYLCMYLFVWSDVLWEARDLPGKSDVLAAYLATGFSDMNERIKLLGDVERENGFVTTFRESLGKVRKALANIPTYMILDDHEITDDFHLSRAFCENVYGTDKLGNDNEMGRLVIKNGLVAYALCQHWGNDPSAFYDNAVTNPAGRRLLAALDRGGAETYKTQSDAIASMVGVHKLANLRAPPEEVVGAERKGVFAVYHDKDALNFDYVVTFPSHQVIVTDSRTWRSFPHGRDEAGELLPKDQIRRQIADVIPATGQRPLFVVMSTNAPPVPIIRFGERNPWKARRKAEILDNDPEPDLWDSWELPSAPMDRLMVALSDRVPKLVDQVTGTVRRGSAVLLSGDVHSSFATRLQFRGRNRFEDATPQAVNMVVAQLVSSSLRNQSKDTLGQHEAGFPFQHWLVGDTVPEGYLGWNLPKGVTKGVGAATRYDAPDSTASEVTVVSQTGPGTRGRHELTGASDIILQPDYAYRLDYVPAVQEHPIPAFAKTPLPPPGNEAASQQAFRAITANYRDFVSNDHPKRDIVGVTNISEVTLSWDPLDDRKRWVNQTVRWYGDASGKVVMLTTQTISLNPDDSRYAMSTVLKPLGWTQPLPWAP